MDSFILLYRNTHVPWRKKSFFLIFSLSFCFLLLLLILFCHFVWRIFAKQSNIVLEKEYTFIVTKKTTQPFNAGMRSVILLNERGYIATIIYYQLVSLFSNSYLFEWCQMLFIFKCSKNKKRTFQVVLFRVLLQKGSRPAMWSWPSIIKMWERNVLKRKRLDRPAQFPWKHKTLTSVISSCKGYGLTSVEESSFPPGFCFGNLCFVAVVGAVRGQCLL